MKILSVKEEIPEEPTDAEGLLWLNCIRAIQFFMVTVSLTTLIAITNPFSWTSNTVVIITALLLAVQCALVTVIVFSLCAQRPPSNERELEKGNKNPKKSQKTIDPASMYQNIV